VAMGRHGLRALSLALSLSASLAGCGGLLGGKAAIGQHRLFIIEAEPLSLNLPDSERPYPFKVEIGAFEVKRLYDNEKIVFRLSPQEIKTDRYHRWAVRPGNMITDAVEQYLSDAHLFADIRQEFLDTTPDFTLTGTVEAIERFDSGNLWYASLVISMQLVDKRNETFWGPREFTAGKKQVYIEDFSHTVVTLRQLLRGYMAEAIRELDIRFLTRKLQDEGLPFAHLLDKPNGAQNGSGEQAVVDTARSTRESQPGYEIIPGKAAP
jgi:ABC-type uncharacterized transport system auxiliary subunit